MSELLTRASGPPSRQTLIELLATLPMPAALCDEALQWLTANEAYRQFFPDGETMSPIQRLQAVGLGSRLAAQPLAPHILIEIVTGETAQAARRVRLRIGRVTSADAGPLCWIVAEPLELDEEGRRNPIADRDAYRLLFDEAVVPMTMQNTSYQFIDANDAFCRYSGFTREELIGANPFDLFEMSEQSRVEALAARACMDWSGAVPYSVEDRKTLRPNGDERRYNLIGRPAQGSSGERVVLNTVIDITDLKRAQERLQQQLHWFETMLTTTSAGVAVLDRGRFLRVNRQFERLTGWSAQELQGASPASLFGGPDDWLALLERIDRTLAGGAAFVEELTPVSYTHLTLPTSDLV